MRAPDPGEAIPGLGDARTTLFFPTQPNSLRSNTKMSTFFFYIAWFKWPHSEILYLTGKRLQVVIEDV